MGNVDFTTSGILKVAEKMVDIYADKLAEKYTNPKDLAMAMATLYDQSMMYATIYFRNHFQNPIDKDELEDYLSNNGIHK